MSNISNLTASLKQKTAENQQKIENEISQILQKFSSDTSKQLQIEQQKILKNMEQTSSEQLNLISEKMTKSTINFSQIQVRNLQKTNKELNQELKLLGENQKKIKSLTKMNWLKVPVQVVVILAVIVISSTALMKYLTSQIQQQMQQNQQLTSQIQQQQKALQKIKMETFGAKFYSAKGEQYIILPPLTQIQKNTNQHREIVLKIN